LCTFPGPWLRERQVNPAARWLCQRYGLELTTLILLLRRDLLNREVAIAPSVDPEVRNMNQRSIAYPSARCSRATVIGAVVER